MTIPTTRKVSDSLTEMTEIVLPQHTNRVGTAFGGTVMAWIDVCGAITAGRHAGRICVTAAVDDLIFLSPIHLGDVVVLHGRINAAFSSSMEVEVVVEVEHAPGQRRRSVEALMTFVAIDDKGKPTRIPSLECASDDERVRSEHAGQRRADRLARRR